jgi:hypothetical protein
VNRESKKTSRRDNFEINLRRKLLPSRQRSQSLTFAKGAGAKAEAEAARRRTLAVENFMVTQQSGEK